MKNDQNVQFDEIFTRMPLTKISLSLRRFTHSHPNLSLTRRIPRRLQPSQEPLPSLSLARLSISFGVAVATYGEARFNSWEVNLQLLAVGFEATRLVLIQILLNAKGISLNPITSLYYVASYCFAFLCIPWIVVEFPNLLCAFALNLAVFLLLGKTSALTMNVAGVVKNWLLITFSWSVIKDTVTPINLIGRLRQDNVEAGKLLEERDKDGKKNETQD
ncbi:hypothetical protein RchiOBHm_Chr2g0085641 [Rosa chinensis]|uniref:Uncharacterized protein n=1 Tax=Rosa chinensis TaxID=74649 RepID=A0A2P6RI61_ROSCH|nr:hypothetical protein RchiOBHm_Chr2g0085641 [Rosa chinensis]